MGRATRRPLAPESIRALRLGHGANCSSIGSVVDTLFVTSLLGGALFAAVLGALEKEPIEIVGPTPKTPDPADEDTTKTTSEETP